MRLSTSLARGVMETGAGAILNKFQVRKRRNVLFFEDILAQYIKECEQAGYGKEMSEIARKWMNLATQELTPSVLKKLPPTIFFNTIAKKVWKNLGLMDDIKCIMDKDVIILETKNEAVTRLIGKNQCLGGFYEGILNVLLKSEFKCIKKYQSKKRSTYTYKHLNVGYIPIKGKSKEEYDKFNKTKGLDRLALDNALKNRFFELRGNCIYFRGKSIWTVENTVFHLLGNSNILLDSLPSISYNYFSEIINTKISRTKKIGFLKNLLQVMGWGIISISEKKDEIAFEIIDFPHGLQSGQDNLVFIARIIQGYLWLIDENLKIKTMGGNTRKFKISYCF